MSTSAPLPGKRLTVLQIMNHYEAPFLDVTRQYAVLFRDLPVDMVTVFLRGAPTPAVTNAGIGKVVFLELSSGQVKGLKWRAIRAVRALQREYRFDLCIAHRYHPIKIALKSGDFPVLAVHHRFGTYTRWERRFVINRYRPRLTLLGVSDFIRDDTRSALPGWPHDKIQTFHNHIDVEALTQAMLPRAQARQELNLPAAAFVVGNVGRLHRDKDQRTLLAGFARALPSLPASALLVIHGKGKLRDALEQQARELGIAERVIFGGFVANLPARFSAFDVFALTSDHEPFGMVLLEAMVAKVPVIASDCGGAPEVVGDAGMKFPLGDADKLAAALVQTAQLTDSEREARVTRQLDRVRRLFSDDSARHDFRQRFLAGFPETPC